MDKLTEIFQRQAAYVVSLRPTYLHNGFTQHSQDMPWDLNGRHSQEEFRLLAWRTTEEIVEAMQIWEGNHDAFRTERFQEEVADALHFFIELCLATDVREDTLLMGIDGAVFMQDRDRLEEFFYIVSREALRIHLHESDPWYEFIRALAHAIMHFRQRPWRTDFRETDRRAWVMGLHLAFRSFVEACIQSDVTAEALHSAYFKKAKVNIQRIEDYGIVT